MHVTPDEGLVHNQQPGAAWHRLDPRSTAVVASLFALGLVGWYVTFGEARDMSGMVTGLGQLGTRMPNDMGVAAFMAMWLWMMVAMMLPALAPVVIAARAVGRVRDDGKMFPIGFVAVYLAAWVLLGLVPLAAFLAFGNLPLAAQTPWLRIGGGAVLLLAGLYQFTPWKRTCLRACRAPLDFVMRHGNRRGAARMLHAGVSYGAYCVGSCGALMAVLLVVGLMNLAWMAAIAIVFLAEKNWRHGVAVMRVVGGGLAVLGLAVAAMPTLLSAISS